jgi:hypothetical protein
MMYRITYQRIEELESVIEAENEEQARANFERDNGCVIAKKRLMTRILSIRSCSTKAELEKSNP